MHAVASRPQGPALSTTETHEFIDVDQSIAICAPATEDDIVREVQEENENEQEDSEEQFTVPTLIDGLNAGVNEIKRGGNPTADNKGQKLKMTTYYKEPLIANATV
ncbi:hypothetical protein RR48_03620 [Papilio machaon]|uniref:Uncharacterized protein n=1 Tax=Papilio machaon TaxID=76193 RepID=A0A0N1PG32_PAPMA|nr:hypothetical protein RR48_03620 [Papilio machaon]